MTTLLYEPMSAYLAHEEGEPYRVQLMDVMPHPSTNVWPETAVVNAARISFLGHSKGPEADKKLLLYLLNHRHTSPFEHVIFKFRINAPVVVWWQWVRHRTWSFNFQSGRYVEFEEEHLHEPVAWRRQSQFNKQGSDGLVEARLQNDLNDLWLNAQQDGMRNYRYALDNGVAKEQARLFLPGFGVMYQAIATVDAHNLMHFLSLRLHREAQLEIREYAQDVMDIFAAFMPTAAEWLMEKMNG